MRHGLSTYMQQVLFILETLLILKISKNTKKGIIASYLFDLYQLRLLINGAIGTYHIFLVPLSKSYYTQLQ